MEEFRGDASPFRLEHAASSGKKLEEEKRKKGRLRNHGAKFDSQTLNRNKDAQLVLPRSFMESSLISYAPDLFYTWGHLKTITIQFKRYA